MLNDTDTDPVRAAEAMRDLSAATRERLIREAGDKVIDVRHWHRDYVR